MYNRDHRFEDRDALSHSYLRSAPSYGDYLRRQNVDEFARFNDGPPPMRPPDHRFPPHMDVQDSWRGPPSPGQGWRREGGPLPHREEFPPRPGFMDERLPFRGGEPSVSWRNERGGGRFGDRPDVIAAPRSGGWNRDVPSPVEPRDPQRSIAPAVGCVRDEVWRPTPSASTNWRNQPNNNPYNGIRPREIEPRDTPPRERRSRWDNDDGRKRTYSSTRETDERREEEPPAAKAREDTNTSRDVNTSRDDSWRTPANPAELGKIKDASPIRNEKETSIKEEHNPTQGSDSTQSNQKSSLKIHKANFEDVHLFHLPEYKRHQRDISRDESQSRSEQGREGGGRPRKSGSLVIHDAKFEDVHMFHLKDGEARNREESWAQQYKKRVESVKQQNDNRAPWKPTPHSYEDTRVPMYADRERPPPPVHNYEPPIDFDRRPSPEPFRGDYFSAERQYPPEEVPYNQLPSEPIAPSTAESKPLGRYNYFDSRREEAEVKPKPFVPPPPQHTAPLNPNDYVEEFTDEDWNEVADLVNSVGGPPKSNHNSPVKQAPVARRTLLGSAPEPLPSNVSYFRSELPSVRGKGASQPPAHSVEHHSNNYQERAYDDYQPTQQWRNNEDYEGGDWRYSRH